MFSDSGIETTQILENVNFANNLSDYFTSEDANFVGGLCFNNLSNSFGPEVVYFVGKYHCSIDAVLVLGYGRGNERKTSWIQLILISLGHNRKFVRNFLLLSAAMILILIGVSYLVKKIVHQAIYDDDFKDTFYGNILGNHTVFYRKDWGGLLPKMGTVFFEDCVPLLIISHSGTRSCYTFEECSKIIRYLQKDHQTIASTLDIGMNFLIGGDGNIYVGRGWDIENYSRKNSLLLGFVGDYVYDTLTESMIDAAQQLIYQGLNLGKLCLDYEMVGENQTSPKMFLSPGDNVYKIIKTWPNFNNKIVF